MVLDITFNLWNATFFSVKPHVFILTKTQVFQANERTLFCVPSCFLSPFILPIVGCYIYVRKELTCCCAKVIVHLTTTLESFPNITYLWCLLLC